MMNLVLKQICKMAISISALVLGLYGFLAGIVGLVGGFPNPCDVETIATTTSCMPSEEVGKYIYSITYEDLNGILHTGKIINKAICPFFSTTQYIEICYRSYDPASFKTETAFFSNYKIANGLFISGIVCLGICLSLVCCHRNIFPCIYKDDNNSTYV